MPGLIKRLSEEENHSIMLELERLFILQDKPFPDPKKILFSNELSMSGLPAQAILQGVRALRNKEMRSIKLFDLMESIQTFVEVDINRTSCIHCRKDGCIIMFDTIGNTFAVACICENGEMAHKFQSIMRWNGKDIMESNKRLLYRTLGLRGTEITAPNHEMAANVQAALDTFGGTVVN